MATRAGARDSVASAEIDLPRRVVPRAGGQASEFVHAPRAGQSFEAVRKDHVAQMELADAVDRSAGRMARAVGADAVRVQTEQQSSR
jgi:hypothetical protein